MSYTGSPPDLHDFAQIHHDNPVAHVSHHVEIVRNEQVGQAECVLQGPEQIEHLGLDRLIECRHRLIENDDLGRQRNGSRYIDALALAARKLVRITFGEQRRRQSHQRQRFARLPLGSAARFAARGDAESYLFGRRVPWIERSVAILKYHLYAARHLAAIAGRAHVNRSVLENDTPDVGHLRCGPGDRLEWKYTMRTFTLREAQSMLPVLESLLRKSIESKTLIEQIDQEFNELSERIFLNGGTLVDVRACVVRKAQREKAIQPPRIRCRRSTPLACK